MVLYHSEYVHDVSMYYCTIMNRQHVLVYSTLWHCCDSERIGRPTAEQVTRRRSRCHLTLQRLPAISLPLQTTQSNAPSTARKTFGPSHLRFLPTISVLWYSSSSSCSHVGRGRVLWEIWHKMTKKLCRSASSFLLAAVGHHKEATILIFYHQTSHICCLATQILISSVTKVKLMSQRWTN